MLGKIQMHLGKIKQALEILKKAEKILKVTHGENHSLFKENLKPILFQAVMECQ